MTVPDGRVARGFRVTGRVQGVGFRWWTEAQARALDLSGFVRNLADGSVEVQAVGTVEDLERLERALWDGPDAAAVARVEEHPVDPLGRRSGFAVDYGGAK